MRDSLINEKNIQKYIQLGYSNGYQFRNTSHLEGYKADEFYVKSTDFDYLKIIKILITVFGDVNNLISAIERTYKDSKYTNMLNHRMAALKVITPIQILMENFNNPVLLTVSFESNQSYPHEGKNIIYNPFVRLFNINININSGWSSQHPYTGEESFYVNSREFINEKDVNNYIKSMTKDGNSLSMIDLLSTLKNTLAFLKNHDFLDVLA